MCELFSLKLSKTPHHISHFRPDPITFTNNLVKKKKKSGFNMCKQSKTKEGFSRKLKKKKKRMKNEKEKRRRFEIGKGRNLGLR
jgi:hypothetical protein